MAKFGSGWWLKGKFSPAITQAGAGGGAAAFDGTFFDTDAGDVFTDNLVYTPDASFTVNASTLAFSSPGADVNLNVRLKFEGIEMLQCFDKFTVEVEGTINALAGNGSKAIMFGMIDVSNSNNFFGGETGNHPGAAGDYFQRQVHNGSFRVNGSNSAAWTKPVTFRCVMRRDGRNLSTSYYYAGVLAETISFDLGYAVASDNMPTMMHSPCIRFIRGDVTVDRLKVSADFPQCDLAIVGDSLTQGAQASTYADAWPQLVRAAMPTKNIVVCGAPSALIEFWIANIGPVLAMQPRYVAIALGVNNIISYGESGALVASRLKTLADTIAAAGAIPVFLNLPPLGYSNSPDGNAILSGYGYGVIDIYTVLKGTGSALNPAYNVGDNVHWNSAGHAVVDDPVVSYFTPLL